MRECVLLQRLRLVPKRRPQKSSNTTGVIAPQRRAADVSIALRKEHPFQGCNTKHVSTSFHIL